MDSAGRENKGRDDGDRYREMVQRDQGFWIHSAGIAIESFTDGELVLPLISITRYSERQLQRRIAR